MNIQEFRQQYPQYDRVDDKTLADALYKKYYSDKPREAFDASFLKVEPPQDVPPEPQPTPQPEKLSFSAGISPQQLEQGTHNKRTPDIAGMTPIGRAITAFRSDTGGPSAAQTALGAIKNAPRSAVELGKAMVQPVLHPIETYRGIEGLVKGVYSKATGGDKADQQTLDAMINMYAENYGTAAKFKEYLKTNPAMVFADTSAFLKTIGTVGKISSAGRTKAAYEAVGKAADYIAPSNLVKQAVTPSAKLVKDSVPEELYKSGAKFKTGKRFTVKDRDRAVTTALNNGILTKESTVFKVWDKINENTAQVDAIIDTLAQEGTTIPRNKLYRGLVELKQKVHPQAVDRKRAINVLIRKLRKSVKEDIPVSEVQELKRNIHAELENHYIRTAPKPAIINDFNESVARAAMLELEELYPQLKTINKETSDYLHLVKALEQSAKRVGNKNLISFDTILKGMLGHQVGDSFGMVVGLALGLLDKDLVKQRIAVVLRKAKTKGLEASKTGKKNLIYGAGQTGIAQGSLPLQQQPQTP